MKIAGLILACCLLSLAMPGEAAEDVKLNLTEVVKPLVLVSSMDLIGLENVSVIADYYGDLDFESSTRLRLNPEKKYILLIVEAMEE